MKKSFIIILLALGSLAASAQSTLRSAYFLEDMTMRHKLNPAIVNESNYFTVPLLGNVSLGTSSNMGLNSFLFPLESGSLGTFLHPSVSQDQFLGSLADENTLDQNLDLTIFSRGFAAFGGYNTVGLSLRQSSYLNMPKSYFEFLKQGSQSAQAYDLGGLSFNATNFAELALGHARKINDQITVGATAKFLLGIGSGQLDLDKMQIEMSEDQWMINAHGTGNVALLGQSLINGQNEFDFGQFSGAGLGGFGMGIDLGATYEDVIDNLNLSIAITDLGFISWSAPNSIEIEGGTTFTGFEDIDINDFEASTEATIDGLTSDLESLMTPKASTGNSYSTTLHSTLAVGAEYEIVENMLSAGLLSSTTFGSKTVSELMLSANYQPIDWFNMALTGSVSNIGSYWGWIINFCPKGFNLFIGTDRMISTVTPQFIPCGKLNFNVNFGINVCI